MLAGERIPSIEYHPVLPINIDVAASQNQITLESIRDIGRLGILRAHILILNILIEEL